MRSSIDTRLPTFLFRTLKGTSKVQSIKYSWTLRGNQSLSQISDYFTCFRNIRNIFGVAARSSAVKSSGFVMLASAPA